QPLSRIALRPRGPRVLVTAFASFWTPLLIASRASDWKTICLAMSGSAPGGWLERKRDPHWDRAVARAFARRVPGPGGPSVLAARGVSAAAARRLAVFLAAVGAVESLLCQAGSAVQRSRRRPG